ncbi:unnamed protein product [Pleuronectes platessa]|uniref:Uncharacterized protein n=1 Tax=Pleuronectes platessa TaxID=8262 RepID=A0A9N7YRM4_PLEPL|nr:unnamed protein product [Pleuronectes platessa]
MASLLIPRPQEGRKEKGGRKDSTLRPCEQMTVAAELVQGGGAPKRLPSSSSSPPPSSSSSSSRVALVSHILERLCCLIVRKRQKSDFRQGMGNIAEVSTVCSPLPAASLFKTPHNSQISSQFAGRE